MVNLTNCENWDFYKPGELYMLHAVERTETEDGSNANAELSNGAKLC